MSGIRLAATVVYIVICAVLLYFIFKGKGEGADLSGGIVSRTSNETYYSVHGKKHSADARRERTTAILVAVFLICSVLLNMSWGY